MKFVLPQGYSIILASASPRRRELLTQTGLPFRIMTSDADETYPPAMHPHDAVRLLAERKARAVAASCTDHDIIIGADTLVEVDGRPLGKPKDEADARNMLLTLSGRHHNVHTGVCVVCGQQMLSDSERTDVVFYDLDRADADAYIATGEPMDKAGAYAIQGQAQKFVSHINGNLDNVIGLPCALLDRLLCELTIS